MLRFPPKFRSFEDPPQDLLTKPCFSTHITVLKIFLYSQMQQLRGGSITRGGVSVLAFPRGVFALLNFTL